MKKWMLALAIVCSGLSLCAQEIVLEGYDYKNWPENEKKVLEKIPPPNFKLPKDYALKRGDGTFMSWQYLAQAKISSFMYNIREYSTKEKVDKAVACAYSVFGLENHTEDFGNAVSYSRDPETIELIYTIYQTKSYHDQLFSWLKPSITAAWETEEPRYKETFQEMMAYIVDYLKTLDVEKETEYLKKNESNFAYQDRLGNTSPYRKGAAWCFRRIHLGHMSKAYLLEWCEKIQKEIMK